MTHLLKHSETKLCIVSIHSGFASADCITNRLLSFLLLDELLISGVSLPVLMKAWVWSWAIAASGVHPFTDHEVGGGRLHITVVK